MKRTSPSRLGWKVAGVALVVLAVLLWRGFFASLVWRLAMPVMTRSPLPVLASYFESKAALAEENAQLRSELASSSAALADYGALSQQVLQLKAEFGRSDPSRRILAGVLMRPPATPYDTLMVDAGRTEGIVVGDLVFAGSAVIGSVDAAYPTAARVVLLSAPGQSYSATLAGTSSRAALPLTVAGQGGGSLSAQVPAQTPVAVGDSVNFPGLFGGYVGKISAIREFAGDSFKTLYLHLPVNPQELQYVELQRTN